MGSAHAVLALLQENSFPASGWRVFPKQAYAEAVSDFRNKIRSDGPYVNRTIKEEEFLLGLIPESLPSAYENPIYYLRLHLVAKFLEEHFAEFSKHLPPLFGIAHSPKKVVLGTLPVESVNAVVYDLSPHDEVLICFRAGLFDFLDGITQLVVEIVEELGRSVNDLAGDVGKWGKVAFDQEALERHLDANPSLQNAFLQIILKYAANLGNADLADILSGIRRGKAPRESKDWELFGICHLMFVLGHEYGHLLAGHLTPTKGALCMIGGIRVENQRNSWEEEMLADLIGEGLVETYLASLGMRSGEGKVVAAFCLSALDLLQRAMAIIRTGYEENRPVVSHPPHFIRRYRLQTMGLEGLRDEERVATAIVYRSSKMLEYVLETLWHREKRHIYHELKKCKTVFQRAEIERMYPDGVAGLPYKPLTPADNQHYEEIEKDTVTTERGAFKYGAMRAYLYLAPYAVAEGHATEADAIGIRENVQKELTRFLPPTEAKDVQKRTLGADELFAVGEKGLERWGVRIQLAADVGSLVTAFKHLGHSAAERLYSGMAKRINGRTFGVGYPSCRSQMPDDLRVWRAVSELCATGVCGVVPSQSLKERCVLAVENYYLGSPERWAWYESPCFIQWRRWDGAGRTSSLRMQAFVGGGGCHERRRI